jgi:hypothetical protein
VSVKLGFRKLPEGVYGPWTEGYVWCEVTVNDIEVRLVCLSLFQDFYGPSKVGQVPSKN